MCYLQKNLTGERGANGLYVVKNVVVGCPIEDGDVISPNVLTPITKSVLEVVMRRNSVTSSAVQVSFSN